MSALQALAAAEVAVGDGELARLRATVRLDFLDRVGWEPHAAVMRPEPGDALLGLKTCAVADCGASTIYQWAELCRPCRARWQASTLDWQEFLALPSGRRPRRSWQERCCRVEQCPRPANSIEDLCGAHVTQRANHPGEELEQWLQRSEVRALPSFGRCAAVSCARTAAISAGLCRSHAKAWSVYRRQRPATALQDWAKTAGPVRAPGHIIDLRGLNDRVVWEILAGLQRRTDAGLRTFPTCVRYLVKMTHARGATSLLELEHLPSSSIRTDAGALLRSILRELRCVLCDPETERSKDLWHLVVFGLPGVLDFTGITQVWLREAVKRWAGEDLPLRRGRQAAVSSRDTIRAAEALSASLAASRADAGTNPAVLGRDDIVCFTNRMAYLQRSGQISADTRLRLIRRVFRLLGDIHALGMTQPDQPAAGLVASFILRRDDIPRESADRKQPRSLPPAVLAVIADNLHVLEQRCGVSERRITELLIDTGRRPEEICTLAWDCLEYDSAGNPVLIYTDFKNNRPGCRLPIAGTTAKVITAHKEHIRGEYPHTAVSDLVLFPGVKGNKDGTKPIHSDVYSNAHRIFIDTIAELLRDTDGQPFDPARAVPYAYRHSYAQRHADAGVAPDVLRELMGHRSMRTTAGYYRVSEKRIRTAIDRVIRHQFDATGTRVFDDVSGLLDTEHARMRVGQVAVPFGVCTEPSNVKAGGNACPYKYVCTGCAHFRSDPSYLPELKSYLQQLLAERERLHATEELQPWARTQAAPPEEQIDQLRELIHRIEGDLDQLSEHDRAQVQQAIDTVRTTRQTVMLGMPGTSPDLGAR